MWSIHYGLHIPNAHPLFKDNLECVHQCIKIHQKETNGLIFETNCSSIKQRFKKLWDDLLSKREKNKHTCPIFDNDFLASSNQMKLKSTDYIFPIKQDDICYYNPLCFMSSVIMLDDIIMNIFTQSTKIPLRHTRSTCFQIQGWCN